MSRRRTVFGFVLAIVALWCATAAAGGFGRVRSCGVVHHAQVVKQIEVVEKPVYVPQQTIVFNNAYPAAAPGATAYASSYQDFAAPYQPTALTFAALSSESLKIASQNAASGQGLAQVEAGLEALRLQTQQIAAVTQHLAAGLRGAAGGGSQTLVLQIGADGTVRTVAPEQAGHAPQEARQPDPRATSLVSQRCAACHTGPQPNGEIYLDGIQPLDDATYRAAVNAVLSGRMPPSSKPPLTDAERMQVIQELGGQGSETTAVNASRRNIEPSWQQMQPIGVLDTKTGRWTGTGPSPVPPPPIPRG